MTTSALASRRRRRTSYLDRTWHGYWSVLALAPIPAPDAAELRAKMAEFMVHNPTHPLSCTLSGDGRSWQPVPERDRERHLGELIVAGPGVDGTEADPYPAISAQRPVDGTRLPFKLVVGTESIIIYFSHVAGDVTVLSPVAVLLALGDVDGLQALAADAGLPTAGRVVIRQFGQHWRQWWQHLRSERAAQPAVSLSAAPDGPVGDEVTAVFSVLDTDDFAAFKAWRKGTRPGQSATALMASATYRAFAAEGLPMRRDAFYTLVNVRRYLPKSQATRAGNLAKSVLIHTDLADPGRVGTDMAAMLDSARAVPALLSGGVSEALRSAAGWARAVRRRAPSQLPGAGIGSPSRPAGGVTMTFNSMPRNPGVDHIPWTDRTRARYLGMAYPVAPDGITVFVCGVEDSVEISAVFNPDVLDRDAVRRALARLSDMPGLLADPPAHRSTLAQMRIG